MAAIVLIAVSISIATRPALCEQNAESRPPNILLIVSDDKHYTLLAMIPKRAKNRRKPANIADFWIAEDSGKSMGITGN